MTHRFLNFLLAGLLGLSLVSCGSDLTNNFTPTPAAFGKINSLYVIADSTLWIDGASDSVAYFLVTLHHSAAAGAYFRCAPY